MLSALHGYQGANIFTFLQCEPIVFTGGGKTLPPLQDDKQEDRLAAPQVSVCKNRGRASQSLEKAPKYLHSFRSQKPSHKDVALPNARILVTLSRRTKATHGREIQTPVK